MTEVVQRNYLEIKSLKELKESHRLSAEYSINLIDPTNFQLNKFFYKNIGKDHKWVDRLIWTEQQWIDYISSDKVKTYILKKNEDLVGFFELVSHLDTKEIEIAYFGILKEYQNKKIGSFMLSEAIKICFVEDINRVWLHTCSLDHKNALKNYLNRGMKIFREEKVKI